MTTCKNSRGSKLINMFVKAPLRILRKARDFYIKGTTENSQHFCYTTAMGWPAGQVNAIPRSFSVGSTKSSNSNDDYRELLRLASARNLSKKIEPDLLPRQQPKRSPLNKTPRSCSVAIGRIDEEKTSEFVEDIKDKADVVKADVFRRSKSYAVSRRAPWTP